MHSTLKAPPILEAGPDVFVMPCSAAQKRFWMLEQISPGDTALVIPIAIKLSGPLRPEIVEEALNRVVERHEILRTRFEQVEDEPKQIIAPAAALKLHHMELGIVPLAERPARIAQVMAEEAERPIPLDRAPLLRATLVHIAPDESVLMLTAHHIISDGWSNGLLVREFGAFYHACLRNQPADLPPLSIQYADYVVWQEGWLASPDFETQMAYWKQELEGEVPALDFPTDFARRGDESHAAVLEGRLLPKELADRLRSFCHETGTTLFMIFFSAYLILLQRYTGQSRLLVATTGANRNRPELEQLIGLFSNILLLPSDVPADESFRSFLLRQRDHLLGNFAHQEVPFEQVAQQWQSGKRRTSKNLIQTHFLFQKAFMQPLSQDDLTIQPLYSVSPGSTFELTFGIVERAEGIRLQMEYWTSLFRQGTIRRFLAHFQALLTSALADPDLPVAQLPIYEDGEKENLELGVPAQSTTLAASPSPVIDTEAILRSLDDQIEKHFQKDDAPFISVPKLAGEVALMVLDNQLQPIPVGVPGDVYLASRSGGMTERSNTVQRPNTSALTLLKSGFIGRNAEGGGVELLGRSDDLIQLSSFRFNRRAAESRLKTHPEVREALSVVRSQESGDVKLVTYVTLKQGAKVTGKDLRAFLRGRISDLLVPSIIIIVEAMPKDATDKIVASEEISDADRKPVAQQTQHETRVQEQLLVIWRNVLKTQEITIDDNFFELGGNSFLALRMMTEAGKISPGPLPLSLLLTGATVRGLAQVIMEGSTEMNGERPLIPVQPKGDLPPLFFLHGDWVGGGYYCHGLAENIGERQPFYAIPPLRAMDGKVPTIGEMAARHRATVEEKFPRGRYRLGGYCIGALVAMEMARQWIAKGETVEQLFLIDPPVWTDPWLGRMWPWFNRVGALFGWRMERRIACFDRYAVAPRRWFRQPLRQTSALLGRKLGFGTGPNAGNDSPNPPPDDAGTPEVLDSLEYEVYFLAYRMHRLKPLSVPTTILIPEATSPARRTEVVRAAQLDPAKTRMEIVPGTHSTCVTQDTSVLAAKMR